MIHKYGILPTLCPSCSKNKGHVTHEGRFTDNRRTGHIQHCECLECTK